MYQVEGQYEISLYSLKNRNWNEKILPFCPITKDNEKILLLYVNFNKTENNNVQNLQFSLTALEPKSSRISPCRGFSRPSNTELLH